MVDIVEESQNLSNQGLIDQTGMSPYNYAADEESRDSRNKKGKTTSDFLSGQYQSMPNIAISTKDIMRPERISTPDQPFLKPEQNYFLRPGSSNMSGQHRGVAIAERFNETMNTEVLQSQTEANFNEIPEKSRKRRTRTESTDSEELERIEDSSQKEKSKIKDKILNISTHELSESKMELCPFFEEEDVHKSKCRDLIEHPTLDKLYAVGGEFGHQLRLYDIKNIEKGNHKFSCMLRRVNIHPDDKKSEESKMK